MKAILIFTALTIASSVYANVTCDSEKNGDGKLLSLQKHALMLENIQVDDIVLFNKKPVKVVDFYVTGGPEQGITVTTKAGQQFNIWCTDENTPIED